MNRSFWLSGFACLFALSFAAGCSKTSGMVLVTANDTIGTTANFYIDQYESSLKEKKKGTSFITVAQSRASTLPASGVNYAEADAYCKAADKRICTVKEWLTACAGPNNKGSSVQISPTSPVSIDTLCYVNRTSSTTVTLIKTGSNTACKTSGLSLYDMMGNVSEWAFDGTQAYAMGPNIMSKVVDSKCSYYVPYVEGSSTPMASTENSEVVGFRCCLDATTT